MLEMLNRYLKVWGLSDPQPLAETVTSHVYTVTFDGERVVLKVLTPIGVEEQSGAVALRHFGGHGAVRLLRADEQAHLLEYASGQDLIPLVENGEDEKATARMADVLNALHATATTAHGALPSGLIPWRT